MYKRALFFLFSVPLFFACGNPDPKTNSGEKKTDNTRNPDYQKGLGLVAKSDCMTCHRVSEKMIGPSYVDIAKKYEGATDANVSELAQRIIKGGAGVWGEIPMTAHPNLSPEDAEAMVKYILLTN